MKPKIIKIHLRGFHKGPLIIFRRELYDTWEFQKLCRTLLRNLLFMEQRDSESFSGMCFLNKIYSGGLKNVKTSNNPSVLVEKQTSTAFMEGSLAICIKK